MGRALEIIASQVTAPGAVPVATAAVAGDSLVVRNTNNQSRIFLLSAWAKNQAAGLLQIRSPRMHDNVVGMQFEIAAASPVPELFSDAPQELISQDTLSVLLAGSATAGDIELAHLLLYYEDLPGVNARLISPDDLQRRIVNIMSARVTIATGVAGGWSGGQAINSTNDQFKANTDYAILGCSMSALAGAIGIQGADFGNLRVGIPAFPGLQVDLRNWFVDISYRFGLPLIPVFNSANKQGVLLTATQDENGADPTVSLLCAQLSPE